jgi:hypothetical protein
VDPILLTGTLAIAASMAGQLVGASIAARQAKANREADLRRWETQASREEARQSEARRERYNDAKRELFVEALDVTDRLEQRLLAASNEDASVPGIDELGVLNTLHQRILLYDDKVGREFLNMYSSLALMQIGLTKQNDQIFMVGMHGTEVPAQTKLIAAMRESLGIETDQATRGQPNGVEQVERSARVRRGHDLDATQTDPPGGAGGEDPRLAGAE